MKFLSSIPALKMNISPPFQKEAGSSSNPHFSDMLVFSGGEGDGGIPTKKTIIPMKLSYLDVPLEVNGSMVNGSMGYFTYLQLEYIGLITH